MRKIFTYLCIVFLFVCTFSPMSVKATTTEATTEAEADSGEPTGKVNDWSESQNALAEKLWNYAIESGYTEWWAAAMVGNCCQESGLTETLAVSGDYFGSFQIQSWRLDDYKKWCQNKGKSPVEDARWQYEYLFSVARHDCVVNLCGKDIPEIAVDSTVIKDAKSAAAYFALAAEGCVCFRGITENKPDSEGRLKFHECSDTCDSFDFSVTGSKYKVVRLQELQKRVANTEKAYKAFKGSIPTNSDSSADGQTVEGSGIISEKDLTGMPEDSRLRELQEQVELMDGRDFSIKEKYIMSTLGDNVNINKEADALDISRRLIMFVGLFVMAYAVLLAVAMVLDKVNNWFELNAVSTVSFGLIKYKPNEDTSGSKKYSSTTKLAIGISIMFIVGAVIISGSIFQGMSDFAVWFSERFLQ